jgi:CHAP domain
MKTSTNKLRGFAVLGILTALIAVTCVCLYRPFTFAEGGRGPSIFARVPYARATKILRAIAIVEPIIRYQNGLERVAAREHAIVRIAASQLGVAESPPDSNITKFGDPGQPWCASFLTWVWRHAGVNIPRLAFSGSIYTWAHRHARLYPPTSRPRQGWAALIGTGPGTSLHVGVIASVSPHGQIKIINGNFGGQVKETGPCLPSNIRDGCEEPWSIYAYAAPSAPVPMPKLPLAMTGTRGSP